MLSLQKNIAGSHADLLIERYGQLRAWALQLTEHDSERAQLLQDFFVHFTVTHPELNSMIRSRGQPPRVLPLPSRTRLLRACVEKYGWRCEPAINADCASRRRDSCQHLDQNAG